MKKNLMTIIIFALLVVNTVMTGFMMFTVIPTNQKVTELVGDISSAIQLDLGITGSGSVASATSQVALADISPYDIADQMTIRLRPDPDGDGKDHYAVVGVTLSLNTQDEDYGTYSETLKSQEGLIKSEIDKVIGSYTYTEMSSANKEDLQSKILNNLQSMYNSKFICGVSFSSWLLQ